MSSGESDSELEAQGVELAKQGQYAEAQRIFEDFLSTKAVSLHRGQVLRNIGITYEQKGNKEKEEVIRVYQQTSGCSRPLRNKCII